MRVGIHVRERIAFDFTQLVLYSRYGYDILSSRLCRADGYRFNPQSVAIGLSCNRLCIFHRLLFFNSSLSLLFCTFYRDDYQMSGVRH